MTHKLVAIRDISLGLFDGPHATPALHEDGAAVFLGISNITESGALTLTEARWVAHADVARWTKRVQPKVGDIVFTYEATLNRYAVIPEGLSCCLGRRTALIRPDKAKVDDRYLFYYFFSPEWRTQIAANTLLGATVDRIPLTKFPEFKVRLPALSVQQEIARALGVFDDLVETNRRRIVLLEEAARLLYREWFVDHRFPGRALVKRNDGLPQGWETTTVGELCAKFDGTLQTGPFGSQLHKDEYSEEGVPVVMPQDIRGDQIDLSRIARIPEHVADRLSRHKLRVGDIVFPRRGEVTKRVLVTGAHEGYVCGTGCLRIRFDAKRLPPAWLFQHLGQKETCRWIENNAVGATMPNLNTAILASVPVLYPGEELVREYAAFAVPIMQQVDSLSRANLKALEARGELLPKLMSGAIRV
ncbi:MAG TPA: hypothetical protein DHV85_06960 [Candidatus Accumulibacter sp.]|nr:hypothetical protein [Accumulibacter sp.]